MSLRGFGQRIFFSNLYLKFAVRDHELGAGLGQHHVARFQVAMDYPSPVRRMQSFPNLRAIAKHLFEW